MDSRFDQLTDWVRQQPGLEQAQPVTVSGDASFRRYFRVTATGANISSGSAGSLIVMDSPPDKEDPTPFSVIARHWHGLGLKVPGIHAENLADGFLLLDDFGDNLLLGALTEANADELYLNAIDELVNIQQATESDQLPLPPYNAALLDREMRLFRDWLIGQYLKLELSDQEHCLLDTTFALLKEAALAQPEVPVHRDYHSRNLLVMPDNTLGVIDFQDAVRGPITYDLVSLVKDCYIAWPEEKISHWIEEFREKSAQAGLHHADADTFRQWVELMGMQRHIKASGIFARLALRDGKRAYLDDIPRTVNYLLEASHRQPALRRFHDWLEARVIPAITRAQETALS